MRCSRSALRLTCAAAAVGCAAAVAVAGELSAGALVAVAAAGGVAFEALLAGPLWRLALRFASAPAAMLEHSVADEVCAVTTFDAEGHGIVAVELDGQVVHVLGTLRREERAAGIRVRAGDRLRVEAVDDARNRCVVSRIG
jgi:hypothetical protein